MLPADDAAVRFYEQLRQRGLFSLVEADCLRRLESPSLAERDRAELVLELSRTYAAHAWQTVGSEQDDLWNRSRLAVREFLRQSSKPAPRELLEVQAALVDLSQAEWLLLQWELNPDDRVLHERGATIVTAALEQLVKLERALNEKLRQGSNTTATKSAVPGEKGDRLRPWELRTLWQQVRLRLGTARLVQAKLVAPGSADRAAALVAADEWLLPLATGLAGERLTWDSQLAMAEVARLRKELESAAKWLNAIEKTLDDAPLDVRERFVVERTRWWLSQNQPTEAAAWLLEQRRKTTGPSAELDYWQLAVELSLWRVAFERQDQSLANDVWRRVEADLARLEAHKNYWSAKAQRDVLEAREIQRFGAELASLVRRARSAYSAGDFDESLRLYEQAISAAKRSSSDNVVLELSDLRATLLFQTHRFSEAASTFQQLADAPNYPRSAATHLLWAICLGKLFDQQPTSTRQQEFENALRSLMERHSKSREASEATWLLGQLAERQRSFVDAVRLYSTISESQARRDEAVAGIARCQEFALAQLRQDGQSTAELNQRVLAQLLPLATAISERLDRATSETPKAVEPEDDDLPHPPTPPQLNRAQAELLTRVARLLLEREPPDYVTADRLLERVIAASRDSEWQRISRQLRVVSLAGQDRLSEAQKLLDSLEEASPDDLLALLDGLTAAARSGDTRTQRLIAELQLSATRRFANAPQKLSAAQQRRLWRTRAEAFATIGEPSQAVSLYQQLVKNSPRDGRLLRAAAELCESLNSTDGFKHAKSFWRGLEAATKAGTLDWLDARWHVIHCSLKLGERSEAEKLLKVTKLLYPELGNAATKARFVELEREL